VVVEDEHIIAMDIQNKLKSLGYQVPAVAHSGEEAIEKAAELNSELVLMDIRLKGEVEGVRAADLLRTQRRIPVASLLLPSCFPTTLW
jgi:CheY-like chemotaxis protein